MKPTITIIGAKGNMGAAFTQLFRKHELKVLEVDVNTGLTAAEAIPQADITLFSVPISATPAMIRKLAPLAKAGSLVTDITSIKQPAVQALSEATPESCEVLGLHPMFGPGGVAELAEQVVVSCPVRTGQLSDFLLGFLRDQGAVIKETTAERHDQMMSVVQGLTHLSSIATAMALKKLGCDVRESLEYSSPIYKLRLEMVGRILGQSPQLYAEIAIENPLTKQSLQAYLDAITQLMKHISSDDEPGFIQCFQESAAFLGDFKDEAYRKTTELIQHSKTIL